MRHTFHLLVACTEFFARIHDISTRPTCSRCDSLCRMLRESGCYVSHYFMPFYPECHNSGDDSRISEKDNSMRAKLEAVCTQLSARRHCEAETTPARAGAERCSVAQRVKHVTGRDSGGSANAERLCSCSQATRNAEHPLLGTNDCNARRQDQQDTRPTRW